MGLASRLVVLGVVAGCYRPAAIATTIPDRIEPPAKAPEPMSWDLDEATAVAYALAHSPVLAERVDLERVADANIGAAKTLEDPELRIGRTAEDELLGTSSKLGVALRVKPPAPWTLDARISRARAERDAERSVSRAAARTLTAEIQELYADLAFADASQTMLKQQLAIRRERARVLAERAATQVETLLAAHDLADLETSISEIDHEQLRARSKLTALLGVPDAQTWKPVIDRGRFETIKLGLVAGPLADRAVAADPTLAELASRVDAAGAEVYEEKAKRLPSLAWVQIERASEDDSASWSIGAALTLPLSNVVGGKLAVARAEQARYRRARERAATSIVQRVRDGVALVEETGVHARDLIARFAPLDAQLEALIAQERAGDPVKLLLLEERHLKSRRDLLAAAYAHRRALIELERIVGSPP